MAFKPVTIKIARTQPGLQGNTLELTGFTPSDEATVSRDLEEFFKSLAISLFTPIQKDINTQDGNIRAGLLTQFGAAAGLRNKRTIPIWNDLENSKNDPQSRLHISADVIEFVSAYEKADITALEAYQAAQAAKNHAEMAVHGVNIEEGSATDRALMFLALERTGVAVKNKGELMKDAAFKAALGPAGKEWSALLNDEKFKAAEAPYLDTLTRPTVARVKDILDMPQGDMLNAAGAITREELDARGDMQIPLLAMRLAYADGKLDDGKFGDIPKQKFLMATLGKAADAASAAGLTGMDKAKKIIADLTQAVTDLGVDASYLETARAINGKRIATNAMAFELDDRTITIPEDANIPVPPMDQINDLAFGDKEIKQAVLLMHLSTSRGGLESLRRLRDGTIDAARAKRDYEGNLKDGPHPKDSDAIKELIAISTKINEAERTGDTGFVLSTEDRETLMTAQVTAGRIFAEQSAAAAQAGQTQRAEGLSALSHFTDTLGRHYEYIFNQRQARPQQGARPGARNI